MPPPGISRRRFVNGTIRLAVVVPLVQVTRPVTARNTRTGIGDADRRTLRGAADVIIPDGGRMPAASSVGTVGYIERIAGADRALERLLLDGLRAIGAQAEATHAARRVLEAAGAARILDSGRVMNFAHYMGTARMGREAKTSVVDARNQAHDVPNLFIVDGSSFTTSAGVNPTTSTIGALALRAGEGIWSRRQDWQ